MEFIKSIILTIIIFILRYAYLDSKLHVLLLNKSKYSSYILLTILLSLSFFYKNKKTSNLKIIMYILLFILGRVIYRTIVGKEVTNNSFHIYNNMMFILGISGFSMLVL